MSEHADKTNRTDEHEDLSEPVARPNEVATNGEEEMDQTMSLEQQLDAERTKAAEYLENWQRSHAEFINFRRRTESERADLVAFANAALIKNLLPILDDFDLALANVPEDARQTSWVEGVNLIWRKVQRLLETEGVRPIEALNQPFDPNIHEAVAVDDGASGSHVVVAELRKGYQLRDRILRPALVRVGDAPAEA